MFGKNLKRILLVVSLGLLFMPGHVLADESKVYLSLFYGEGCPHCAKEERFLKEVIADEFPQVEIRTFEIYHNVQNARLMQEVGKSLNVRVSGVPFLIIGNEALTGYLNNETTGAQVRQIVERHVQNGCHDVVGDILYQQSGGDQDCVTKNDLESITLPLLGEIDVESWSLPVLTVVIAAIDGFNPCAMWVLLFLISLLLGMANRKRMWILGIAFIAASAAMYFLFLAAWLNLFLFLGFIKMIRIVIGLVAVGSGAYHLREYFVNKAGVCHVTGGQGQQKILGKLKGVIEQKTFLLALASVVVLACAVNLIELVCSAGLPAIYTQILALSEITTYVYYAYILLYILIFMLDDIIVFIVTMTTLKMVGLNGKYSRWSNLIGGIVILILGVLLIFKPDWIMFG